MNLFIRIFSALQVPLAVFNGIAGVIGGAWLFYIGEWRIVLIALGALVGIHMFMGVILAPRMLLAPFSESIIKSKNVSLAAAFFALIHLYTTAVITASAFFTFYFFIHACESRVVFSQFTALPFLLLAYEVATEPWASRVKDDLQANPHSNSVFGVFFLTIGCIVTVVLALITGVSVRTCLWTLIGTMTLSWIVQVIISVIEFREEQKYA